MQAFEGRASDRRSVDNRLGYQYCQNPSKPNRAICIVIRHGCRTQIIAAPGKTARPYFLAGHVLVAPSVDVERLTATYRLVGTVPLLSPLARYSRLLKYLSTFIVDKWDSKARLASLIKTYGETSSNLTYDITIIHAEDD
jgi:hypothetical protein